MSAKARSPPVAGSIAQILPIRQCAENASSGSACGAEIARVALLLALVALVQAPQVADPPERESSVIVYGDDPCPQPQADDEIVVCARRPEEERYRIPEPLRRADRPPVTSWTSQVAALEEAQRETRPDGCSVVGSFGQTGCTQEMLRRWRAERRALESGR